LRQKIQTHLPGGSAPVEWATRGGDVLYTAQLAFEQDGSFAGGDIAAQTRKTLDNLKRTVEAAGGTMDDVTQVLVYLTDKEDFTAMNEVYRTFFKQPYPNRATLNAGLFVPGAKIEIIAYAHLPS
jgi:2-iminobutanoate/2-iminopropanoate deaminase